MRVFELGDYDYCELCLGFYSRLGFNFDLELFIAFSWEGGIPISGGESLLQTGAGKFKINQYILNITDPDSEGENLLKFHSNKTCKPEHGILIK